MHGKRRKELYMPWLWSCAGADVQVPTGGETARSDFNSQGTYMDTSRSDLPTTRTNLDSARGYLDTARPNHDAQSLIYNIPNTARGGSRQPENDGGIFGNMMSPRRVSVSNRQSEYDAAAFTNMVTPRVAQAVSGNVTPHHLSMPLQLSNFNRPHSGQAPHVSIVGDTPRLNAQALESVLVSVSDTYPAPPPRTHSSASGLPEFTSRHLGARTHETGYPQTLPTFNMLPANAFMLRQASDTRFLEQNTPRDMETVLVSDLFPPAPCSSYPSSARGPSPSVSGGSRNASPV